MIGTWQNQGPEPLKPAFTWIEPPEIQTSPAETGQQFPSFLIYEDATTRGELRFLGYGIWEPSWLDNGAMADEFNEDAATVMPFGMKIGSGALKKIKSEIFAHESSRLERKGHLKLGHPKRPASPYITRQFSDELAPSSVPFTHEARLTASPPRCASRCRKPVRCP